MTTNNPEIFAAPAAGTLDEADLPPDQSQQDRDLDALCESWVAWCRTRRLYAPSPLLGSILGQLSGKSYRPMRPGGPDAENNAELSAFHLAYLVQPDALDKRIFEAYYVQRIKPVKLAAAALGVSRPHFYRVLSEFRQRVHAFAQNVILANNLAARDDLAHYKPTAI